MRRTSLPRRAAALLLGAAVVALLAGCSGDSGSVSWRDLTLALPDGWVVVDQSAGHVFVGDGQQSPEEGQRGNLSVGMEVSYRPDTTADELRAFVDQEDGQLERDQRIEVDGLPATLVQYTFTTGGTPTRERVVLIPSRGVQLLQQPVPMQGETDGPERFLAHIEEFDALLEGIDFGAPVDFLEGDR